MQEYRWISEPKMHKGTTLTVCHFQPCKAMLEVISWQHNKIIPWTKNKNLEQIFFTNTATIWQEHYLFSNNGKWKIVFHKMKSNVLLQLILVLVTSIPLVLFCRALDDVYMYTVYQPIFHKMTLNLFQGECIN